MPYRNPDLSSAGMPENQQFNTNVASVDISTAAGEVATFTNTTGKRLELQANLSLSALQGIATEFDVEVKNTAGDPPVNGWVDYKTGTGTTHEIVVPSMFFSVANGETVSVELTSTQTNTTVACATVWTRN